VLELNLKLTGQQVLDECRRRGLVVRSGRELAGRTASHHSHLGMPGRAGTLEVSEWRDRVWVKVHPLRDGGWASAFARELSVGGEFGQQRVMRARSSTAVGLNQLPS
jgi:hypothetical protein